MVRFRRQARFVRLCSGTLATDLSDEQIEASGPVQKLKNFTRLLVFETHALVQQIGNERVAFRLLSRQQACERPIADRRRQGGPGHLERDLATACKDIHRFNQKLDVVLAEQYLPCGINLPVGLLKQLVESEGTRPSPTKTKVGGLEDGMSTNPWPLDEAFMTI